MAAALVQATSERHQLGGLGAWSSGCLGAPAHLGSTLASACSQQPVQDLPRRDGGGGLRSVPPPASSVAAQQPARRPRSRGCQHCVSCLGLGRYCQSAASLLQARRAGLPSTASAAAEDWWPSGLPTPTLYFQLRRRQLHVQYKTSATADASAKLWRPTQQTQHGPSALLAARRHRPLGLLIPTTFTNVQQHDTGVQLVGIKDVPLRQLPASSPAAAAPPASTAAATAAGKQRQQLMCCSSEGDLPLRRRQASPPPSLRHSQSNAPTSTHQQQQQQQQQKRSVAVSQHAQRVPRSASLGTPTKRSRLLAPPAQPHLSPSPFAAPAAQQQQEQQGSPSRTVAAAWWLPQAQQAHQAQQQPQQAQQAQQHAQQAQQMESQQAHQAQQAEPWWFQSAHPASHPAVAPTHQLLSTQPSLLATPECLPTALPQAHAAWSARSSLCLSSSTSLGSDGLPAQLNHSSASMQPASATSVLPQLPPPAYASLYPAATTAAPQHAHHAQHAQHAQQQQYLHAQQQQYLQRQYVKKAERAYPVVVDMPPHTQAEAQPGMAAALASLLRLLKRGRDA